MLLSFFHRFLYLFKRTLISCRFEHDLRFLSKKNYTTLPYLRGLCKMMPLYARNDVTLCKTCHILWTHIAAQGMYWRILLWKKHAEICLLILFSSLGCAVFPPMVSSNFLGRCPNHEKISKQCAQLEPQLEPHFCFPKFSLLTVRTSKNIHS